MDWLELLQQLKDVGEKCWKFGCRTFGRGVMLCVAYALVISGLVGCAVYSYRLYWSGIPEPFSATDTGILVAPIPGDVTGEYQRTFAEDIRSLISREPNLASVVKVSNLERSLSGSLASQHEEAIKLGRRVNADVVLRPVHVAGRSKVWMSTIDCAEFNDEIYLGDIVNGEMSKLQDHKILGEVVSILRMATALGAYYRADYEDAVERFTQMLETPEFPRGVPPRSRMVALLADSYSNMEATEHVDRLQAEIQRYEQEMTVYTRKRYPGEWAKKWNQRGMAFAQFPGPDRTGSVREAIRSFDRALEVYKPFTSRLGWATVMLNRGNAYLLLYRRA